MKWLKGLHLHSWWLANLSIGGLLVAIAVAGLVALGINDRVRDVLVRAIQYDLAIEDRADDLRVAVLDMRHYHRNLVFGGPSPRELTEYETAYQTLMQRIDRLEELEFDDPDLPTPNQLRQMAERYYDYFRPAIDLYHTDPKAFELASDDGLWMLGELESADRRIERFGERQAAVALLGVENAANSARLLLIAKLVGHILIGAGLAYLIMRNLREQRQAATELSQSLQVKTDFIADISHELRTPLTVLRANAEVALDLDRSCVHTELLEEIVRESERMTHLVEDLLFLARTDAGAIPFEWELVNIRPYLNDLADRANVLARDRGVHIETTLTADGLVLIDRTRVAQAVLNLVDNATKYSLNGQTIELRSAMSGDEIMLEVVDHGPGIPEQDLPLVFERFYRVDKARTRGQGGAGLGLAITKSIIEAHGGRIEVSSVLQEGTQVRFYLPLATMPQARRTPVDALVIRDA
jgi:two-component system sensor histidine kinase VicK